MKRESVSRKNLSTKSREAGHEQVIEKQIRSVGFPGFEVIGLAEFSNNDPGGLWK